MDKNIVNRVASVNVRRDILGYAIRNEFRSRQRYVSDVDGSEYIYTDDSSEILRFASKAEARKMLKETPDERYEPKDFVIEDVFCLLTQEELVNGFIAAVKEENAFDVEVKGPRDITFTYRNPQCDNLLQILIQPYDEIVTKENAGVDGNIVFDDCYVVVWVADKRKEEMVNFSLPTENIDELKGLISNLAETVLSKQ